MNFPIKKTLFYAALLIVPGGSLALIGIEIYKRISRRRNKEPNGADIQNK